MNSAITKLIGIASAPLGLSASKPDWGVGLPAGSLVHELLCLLEQKNGFYAFESALHVFPLQTTGAEIGLDSWNSDNLWRGSYRDLARDCFFFAEDIFGGQFCIKDDQIHVRSGNRRSDASRKGLGSLGRRHPD